MDPTRGASDLTNGTWEDFEAGLAEVLADLRQSERKHLHSESGILTILVSRDGPSGHPQPDDGWLRSLKRNFRPQLRDNDPSIQCFRMDDCLYCECGGPVEDGGWVRLTTDQQRQIRELGWAQPEGPDRDRWGWPMYCVYFPHEAGVLSRPPQTVSPGPYPEGVDVARAARLVVETLRGPLGARTPSRLRVERRG